jgi:hypothetical protein
MTLETILPGDKEIPDDDDNNPVIADLIEIKRQALVDGDIEAVIAELAEFRQMRDAAESITEEERTIWRELNHKYGKLSDDQITELIHDLENAENGDFINQ